MTNKGPLLCTPNVLLEERAWEQSNVQDDERGDRVINESGAQTLRQLTPHLTCFIPVLRELGLRSHNKIIPLVSFRRQSLLVRSVFYLKMSVFYRFFPEP